MEIIELQKETLEDWAETIPEEYFIDLMLEKPRYYAAGISFLEQPAGALCWEENETGWIIQSIYVFPEFRRLGLATELLNYLSKRMMDKKAKAVSATYTYEDDVAMLNAFFIHYGFNMEELTIPTGRTTLQQVSDCLQKHGLVKKPATYLRFDNLDFKQRGIVDKWMMKHLEVHVDAFETDLPYSYVMLDNDKVKAMLLLSKKEDELSLDYCMFQKESLVKTLPLFVAALDDLLAEFPKDTWVSMLLSNDAAINFYNKLIGGKIDEAVVYTGQYFLAISRLYE